MEKQLAHELLSEEVATAIMRAERRGLSTEEITADVLGEMIIRPGYPHGFAPIGAEPPRKFRVAFWDEFQHGEDQPLGDGFNAGAPFSTREQAKLYCEASWAECGEYDKTQRPLSWSPDGMVATSSYLWEQGAMKKRMGVRYLIAKVSE